MSTLNKKAHRLPLASMSNKGFQLRTGPELIKQSRHARQRRRKNAITAAKRKARQDALGEN